MTWQRPVPSVLMSGSAKGAARDELSRLISDFADDVLAYNPPDDVDLTADPPPVHAVKAGVGIGKSHEARFWIVEIIRELRRRGDKRAIGVAVPTHALGIEAAAEFEAETLKHGWAGKVPIALTAGIWRGREAIDPDAPDFKMCRDPDRVADARSVRANIETACCKATKPMDDDTSKQITCPFHGLCGYQKQKKQTPDVWFFPHELLFTNRPAQIGKLAALIVDESMWQAGLEGVSGRRNLLSVDTLAELSGLDGQFGSRLDALRYSAVKALRGRAEFGPVTRQSMVDAGLSDIVAGEARALEWQRKIDVKLHPAMTVKQRKEAIREAQRVNQTVGRLAMFWRSMEHLLKADGPEASGWTGLEWTDGKDGRALILRLKGRKPISKGWMVPTLLLDANMDIALVKPYWPNVELVGDIAIDTPHMHVRQATDRSNSKQHLELTADLDDDQRRLRTRHMRNLNGIIAALARSYDGQVLVVTQKAINAQFSDAGKLPPNVVTAWHNAVAGIDRWKHADALILVGRTAPSPAAVETLAEALTGGAVPRLPGWYPKVPALRRMLTGDPLPGEADWHPDPICEAIRWQINEGELIQIVGRVRGVNRTEADPIDVWVLTDAVLPLPLTEALTAHSLDPTPYELMLGCAGIALANACHAARAFPDLWTEAAARKAFGRQKPSQEERSATFPYNKTPYREKSQTSPRVPRGRLVKYQTAGMGRAKASAWVDPRLVSDPEAWIVQHLGPLARFECEAPMTETPTQHLALPETVAPTAKLRPMIRQPTPLPEMVSLCWLAVKLRDMQQGNVLTRSVSSALASMALSAANQASVAMHL